MAKENKKNIRQQRLERRVEMARRDDVEVVPKRAAETNDFIRLLTSNDFIINRLRQQLGRRNGVPVEQAVQFLERNETLRQEMNTLNAEICASMGMDYRPPRGFDNPLKMKSELEKVEEKKAEVK
jgi:hypothetical protein